MVELKGMVHIFFGKKPDILAQKIVDITISRHHVFDVNVIHRLTVHTQCRIYNFKIPLHSAKCLFNRRKSQLVDFAHYHHARKPCSVLVQPAGPVPTGPHPGDDPFPRPRQQKPRFPPKVTGLFVQSDKTTFGKERNSRRAGARVAGC